MISNLKTMVCFVIQGLGMRWFFQFNQGWETGEKYVAGFELMQRFALVFPKTK